MMSNEERLKATYDAITDAWRFYKSHFGITNDADDKWTEAISDAVEVQKKHGNTQFIRGLVMVVLELLESEAKEMSA